MVADSWLRKGKTSCCFKNSTSVVLQQCKNKVVFKERALLWHRIKIFTTFFKSLKVLSTEEKTLPTFKKNQQTSNMTLEPFLWKVTSFLHCWRTKEVLFLKQPLIWPFFRYQSAAKCLTDPYKVSNPKLKPDLCNCANSEITESKYPPQ